MLIRLLVASVMVSGLVSARSDAKTHVINTVGADRIVVAKSGDPYAQIDLQLLSFGAFGGLPTLGHDGVAGYALRNNPGNVGSLTATSLNPPPIATSSVSNVVVSEFYFRSMADIEAAKDFLETAPTISFSGHFENVDTVVLQYNSLIALGFPVANVVTGNNSTSTGITSTTFGTYGQYVYEGPFFNYVSLTEFYLDPAPFVAAGQIASAAEFTPFGLRFELLPLGFLPPSGGPELVGIVPGADLGGEPTRIVQRYTFATGVPEPTSWVLMVVGFGLVGAATRRRLATVAA